jgi:hypothetical protein
VQFDCGSIIFGVLNAKCRRWHHDSWKIIIHSKHIKIGSSDSDAPDPKHITIEDPNSDASLGDLPILEPPKKVRRDYECDQEYDFRPGLTSTPVQQFKCEPTDVDDDFPTVMMPTSTFCIEDPKDYTSTVELWCI